MTTPEHEAAEAPTPASEDLQALREQARRAQDYWDQLLRLQADFDNTRKRAARDRLEWERRAGERLLVEFLGVMDDFERALKAVEEDADPTYLRAGLKIVHRRLLDLLKAHGVEPMATVGQPFDPSQHEAVGHIETAEHPTETVVEELRKGYLLHGHVLRPATVKVAAQPPLDTGRSTNDTDEGGS